MSYNFYLNKVLFPVAPSKVTVRSGNQNKTYTMINDGEINVLKKPGLTEIEFDVFLPNAKYPFAVYKNGFKDASYFIKQVEKFKRKRKKPRLVITRQLQNGGNAFGTNMKVSVEDYTIKEDAKNYGTDVMMTLKLKQYRGFNSKKCSVSFAGKKAHIIVKETREADTSPAPQSAQTYKCKKNDTLWTIAKKFYGDGSKYTVLQQANGTDIYAGKIITLPVIS